jgi:hypothetical protein
MTYLESKEWYLWKKRSDKKNPWDRNPFIDTDFLKTEQKRITDVDRWMKVFLKSTHGASLPDVYYYVVPIHISPSWLANFGESNYICKGLSELRNSSFNPLIAFFHPDSVPTDYSLIRINSPKKIALLNSHTSHFLGVFAILIEDWEKQDSEHIYVDVPFERKNVSRLIEESTNSEKPIADSLGAPLISSPYVLGMRGISLVSLLEDDDSSHGLNIALQMMLPPEFRSFSPPPSGIKGKDVKLTDGISIHLAEKIVTGKNYLSSVEGSNFGIMAPEQRKRAAFLGEYSILGAMIKSRSRGVRLYEEMLFKFFESEVSIPNLSEQIDADGILKLIDMIDEDLWLQIASMRDKTPALDISEQEEANLHRRVKGDIEVVLSERGMPEGFRNRLTETRTVACMRNLKREATTIARAENRKKVDLTLLEGARKNFKVRLWMLEEDEEFRDVRYRKRVDCENIRFFILKSILIELRSATLEEIYQQIQQNEDFRTYFSDISDLKRLLNWSERKNKVYRGPRYRYGLV